MRKTAEAIPIKVQTAAAPALTLPQREAVQGALDANRGAAGALLPVLHAIQDALGYGPEYAVPVFAHDLN